MTSRTRGAHPAPEELDLLLEADSGTDPTRDRLDRHVTSCADCREVLAALREVRELLAAERSRVPAAPPDLDDRIAAALAGAGSATAASTAADDAASVRVVPLERRSARVPRWLAAAAGLVVLGGTALSATQLMGGPGGVDAAQESAAGGGAEAAPESAAGAAAAADEARVAATGTDYAPGELEEQVRALLADPRAVAPQAPTEGAEEPSRLADPAALAGCLEALGAEQSEPAVVDLATWQGREVAVIVLDGDGRHAVWVVDPTCRPGADGLVHYQALPD